MMLFLQSRMFSASVRKLKSPSSYKSLKNETYSCNIPYFSINDFKAHIKDFDEIVDVRTPAEFDEDRIFSSINLPVLDNHQRVEVGTLYHKEKTAARKVGAAMISSNCSQHIVNHFMDKDTSYRPLIYCWRGGQRSRSLALILQEIGFQPSILQGGYKDYRRMVRESLQRQEVKVEESGTRKPSTIEKLCLILVSGATGSGKSLLLETLRDRGEQVLHLEQLAKHKGSVLGNYPDEPQPSQKLFESLLYHETQFQLDPSRVVWVENESTKIGRLGLPLGLWNKMSTSPRVHIEVGLEDRVTFIIQDYHYFCHENRKSDLLEQLAKLEKHVGNKKCCEWTDLIECGNYEQLVTDLILSHYDQSYKKPKGKALRTFSIPAGLILDKQELSTSRTVEDLMELGRDYFRENFSENSPVSSH